MTLTRRDFLAGGSAILGATACSPKFLDQESLTGRDLVARLRDVDFEGQGIIKDGNLHLAGNLGIVYIPQAHTNEAWEMGNNFFLGRSAELNGDLKIVHDQIENILKKVNPQVVGVEGLVFSLGEGNEADIYSWYLRNFRFCPEKNPHLTVDEMYEFNGEMRYACKERTPIYGLEDRAGLEKSVEMLEQKEGLNLSALIVGFIDSLFH